MKTVTFLALYFSEGEWAWPNKPDGTRYQANGGYNPEMKLELFATR